MRPTCCQQNFSDPVIYSEPVLLHWEVVKYARSALLSRLNGGPSADGCEPSIQGALGSQSDGTRLLLVGVYIKVHALGGTQTQTASRQVVDGNQSEDGLTSSNAEEAYG